MVFDSGFRHINRGLDFFAGQGQRLGVALAGKRCGGLPSVRGVAHPGAGQLGSEGTQHPQGLTVCGRRRHQVERTGGDAIGSGLRHRAHAVLQCVRQAPVLGHATTQGLVAEPQHLALRAVGALVYVVPREVNLALDLCRLVGKIAVHQHAPQAVHAAANKSFLGITIAQTRQFSRHSAAKMRQSDIVEQAPGVGLVCMQVQQRQAGGSRSHRTVPEHLHRARHGTDRPPTKAAVHSRVHGAQQLQRDGGVAQHGGGQHTQVLLV